MHSSVKEPFTRIATCAAVLLYNMHFKRIDLCEILANRVRIKNNSTWTNNNVSPLFLYYLTYHVFLFLSNSQWSHELVHFPRIYKIRKKQTTKRKELQQKLYDVFGFGVSPICWYYYTCVCCALYVRCLVIALFVFLWCWQLFRADMKEISIKRNNTAVQRVRTVT